MTRYTIEDYRMAISHLLTTIGDHAMRDDLEAIKVDVARLRDLILAADRAHERWADELIEEAEQKKE